MSTLLEQASLVMIPSGYKEDVVYSQIPTNGNGDLSFTRASNGTRINSAGLVEVCPWNLAQYSEDFSNGVWSIQGSSISSDSTTAPNGTTTADTLIESNTTDEHNRFQELNIGTGEFTYSIYLKYFNTDYCALYVFNPSLGGVRYWVNVNTLTAGTSANIGSGIGTTSLSLASVGSGWVRASITFTNPSGVCRFYVANAQSNGGATTYAGNGTNGLYVWGAQLNIGSTAKPYFPTTDRLNVPRLTYQNGGGGCPSLLLEKQSTNLVQYSEQFDNSGSWSYSECSATANQAISPDGTQNADKLIESSANTIHEIYQGLTLTSGTAYTNTIYAKSAERTQIAINFVSGGFGQGSQVIANLSNGTLGSVTNYGGVTGSSATIQNMGNGWYRISLTMTPVSTATFYADYSPAVNGNPFYQGNGTSGVYIWGAQIEASSYPTSYIPTTSASATRVADACSKTGISSLIGQSQGTIFVDVIYDANILSISGGSDQPIIAISDGTFQNYISLLLQGSNDNRVIAYCITSGVSQALILSSAQTSGTIKIAVSYNSNYFALFVNGVKIGQDTSISIPATNSLNIGSYLALGSQFNTNLKETALWKVQLTDAECIALTTI